MGNREVLIVEPGAAIVKQGGTNPGTGALDGVRKR